MMLNSEFILISDIHLGSNLLKVDLLIKFLDKLLEAPKLKELIINGDFIDTSSLRWPNKHWTVIKKLDTLKNHGVKIIWVLGNHDRSVPATALTRLFGYDIKNKYTWRYRNRSFTALHGDCWDPLYSRNSKTIYNAFGNVYRLICKYLPKFARKITCRSRIIRTVLKKVVDNIHHESCKLSINENTSVFTGHTHVPSLNQFGNNVIGNDGSWTAYIPTFISIEPGRVVLYEYRFTGCKPISSVELVE